MNNKKPASLQDPDIQDHCAESLRFPSDVQRWANYDKDDLSNVILGHFLEVSFLVLFPFFFYVDLLVAESLCTFAYGIGLASLEGQLVSI